MTDCSDTGTCVIPMWAQWSVLVVLLALFVWDVIRRARRL